MSWLALGMTLALLAIGFWLYARGRWEKSGLPKGEVIYSDSGTWHRQTEPLYDANLRLVGKPDYLVREKDGGIVPVELKSGSAPQEAHEGHVLQLAAYCLLVDEVYGVRPAYGILQYKDRAFALEYTVDLEEDVLDLLAEMREDMFAEDLDRDHNDWGRCRRCGLREDCYQRLA